MAKKKGEAKALRIAKRKQRRQLKKQAASAKHATVGARVKGLRAGGDQLCQGATLTTFNTTQLKAGEINLNHKPPSSCNEKDISNNLDSLNIRGGHHPLFGSFDSVTGNAHSAVDKCYDNLLFHDDFNTSCRRDQGDIRANWQNRQAEGPGEHAGPRRNLLDAYPDHLELQLNNIAVVTLSLAGQMAKQICLEAIFEFLQKRIPTAERNQFWTCVMGERGFPGHKTLNFPIFEVPLDAKGRKRSVDLILSTCTATVISSFETSDLKTLNIVFNQAIVLCDALDDIARRDALHRTLEALDWYVFVDGVNEGEQSRAVPTVLTDELDISYPLSVDGKARAAVLREPRGEEGDLVRKHKAAHGGFKKPLRDLFVESLQKLVIVATDN